MTSPYKKGKFGHVCMHANARACTHTLRNIIQIWRLSSTRQRERDYFLTELIRNKLANIEIWELQISEKARFWCLSHLPSESVCYNGPRKSHSKINIEMWTAELFHFLGVFLGGAGGIIYDLTGYLHTMELNFRHHHQITEQVAQGDWLLF